MSSGLKIGLLFLIVIASSGCIQDVSETQMTATTVTTIETTTTTTTSTTTTTTSSTTTTIPLEDIRAANQQAYYEYIEAHYSEFEPYLQEGKFTVATWKIRALSDELWKNQTSDDPVKDYVANSVLWVRSNIHYPITKNEKRNSAWRVFPAHKVLDVGYGRCDEVTVLTKALLVYRGIPAQVRIVDGYKSFIYRKEYDGSGDDGSWEKVYKNFTRHAFLRAFIKYEGEYQWVEIDPQYTGTDEEWDYRRKLYEEIDVTEKDSVTRRPWTGDVSKW